MLTAAAICANTGQDEKRMLMNISIHLNPGSQTGITFFLFQRISINICKILNVTHCCRAFWLGHIDA